MAPQAVDHIKSTQPRGRGLRVALLAGTAAAGLVLPLAAQEPPARSTAIEEVVVTARKRPERLQNLAVTATVLSSKALLQRNITDITQLGNVLPAVNINGTFNGRVPLGIRGISSDSNEAAIGIASGVGIEVDGVPIPSDSFAANNVEDLTNVELLEGPQATLGGRTATSGIINYITHAPTANWTGSVSSTLTGDGEQHIVGNVAGPIAQGLDFSLTGWGHHVTFPIANIDYGHSSQSDEGFRAKLQSEIAPDLHATLYGALQRTQSAGANFAYTYVYPGAYLLAGANGGPPFWSQRALFPSSIHIGPDNTDYASPVNYAHEVRTDGQIGLKLDYNFANGYNLSSNTDYQHEQRQDAQDLFDVNEFFGTVAQQAIGAPFAFNNIQTVNVATSQVTEELRLASPSTARLNYVAGIFYSDTNVGQRQYRLFTPAYDNSLRQAGTETADIYVHGNLRVLENTTITGGVRYNHDNLDYSIQEKANPFAPGFVPLGNFLSQGSHESNALVGDIGVKQQIAPNAQVYATYTKGYAPEAYNTAREIASNESLQPVGQEKIDSFEVGTKGRYFGGSLQVNASLFYTIYKSYQVQTFVNVPGEVIGVLDLEAAGKAVTRGGELNATWKPLPDTTIGFNGAWVDAEYLDYQGGPCYWSGPARLLPGSCYIATDGSFKADLSHRPAANAPKIKFDISADQTVHVNDRYDLLLGGDLSYRSRAQFLPDQNPFGYLHDVALLNLHVAVQRDGGKYAFTVFVNNVANRHYDADIEDFWAAPWGSNAIVAQPARDTNRYAGVRFDARF